MAIWGRTESFSPKNPDAEPVYKTAVPPPGIEHRMKEEEQSSSASIPLMIFLPGYRFPNNIDVHEAAFLGMQDLWPVDYRAKIKLSISEFVQKSPKQKYDLSDNEAGALFYYTSNVAKKPLFSSLNTQLATRVVTENFKPYLHYLVSALKKLPNMSGKVFRGTETQLTRVSNLYVPGNKLVCVAFSSTSSDRNTLHEFTKNIKIGGDATWMHISVVEGKRLHEFSCYPKECEVLLMPNAYFTVIEVMSSVMKELNGYPPNLDCIVLEQQQTPLEATFY